MMHPTENHMLATALAEDRLRQARHSHAMPRPARRPWRGRAGALLTAAGETLYRAGVAIGGGRASTIAAERLCVDHPQPGSRRSSCVA